MLTAVVMMQFDIEIGPSRPLRPRLHCGKVSNAHEEDALKGRARVQYRVGGGGWAFKPGTACEHEIEVREGRDGIGMEEDRG